MVVGGAGVEGEGGGDEVLGVFGEGVEGLSGLGGDEGVLFFRRGVGEAGGGSGGGVGVGEVGFDVQNGSAVGEIDAGEVKGGAVAGHGDVAELDEGEAEAVGAIGGAGGEDAGFFVSAEAGRADELAGVAFLNEVEDESEPEVGGVFEAADGVGGEVIAQGEAGGGGGDETGLAGDAEFFPVVAIEVADGAEVESHWVRVNAER